MLQICTMLDLR